MDLQKLLNLINSKTEKRSQLYKLTQSTQDIEELRNASAELEVLDTEIEELRSLYNALSGENNTNATDESWQDPNNVIEGRSTGQIGGFNPVSTFSQNSNFENRSDEDIYDSLEYRNAFKNYVVNGTPIPEKFKSEERSAELTTVGDVGAVIPTTILNKVIEDLTVEGKILGRITQTSYQGGISIPISDIAPEATWLGDENTTSDEQKAKMDAKLSFGYHVLEAKVAIGLLTATVSLSVFEATVVKQLKKAMIKAIETAIVKGEGSGKPLGFLNTEIPEENKLVVRPDEIGTVNKWAEIEGEIDEEVEDNLIYMMSKATWEKYLNGMTDKNGQKIGLGKINEKGQKILNGREVLTSNKFPSFDKAQDGEVFAALVDLGQYLLNSNLAMYYKKYFNEDTNKWVHKSLMIADGKMCIGKTKEGKIVGAQSLMLLKKGASLTAAQLKKLRELEKQQLEEVNE